MGLLEVVAEDLVELAGLLAWDSPEPVRIALVQFRARLLGDPEVRGVADEDVPEPKAVLSLEDGSAGLDELLARERH